jgi:hypothetical protein
MIVTIIVVAAITVSSLSIIDIGNNRNIENTNLQNELKYNCNGIINSFDKITIIYIVMYMGEKKYIIQKNKSNSTNNNSNRDINYQIMGLICLLFMSSMVLFFVSWYSAKR